MTAERMIVYTLRNCPTCDKAREGLRGQGVEFEERRVDEDPKWWEEALKYAVTVPIILQPDGRVEVGWGGEHG